MVVPIAVVFVLLYMSSQIEAQGLQVGFYENKCNDAEPIVRQEVEKAFARDKGIAPGLIRMHFHDCFAGEGCEGSILIDSTPNNVAEKDGPPNGISLRGAEVIDSAKAKLESRCKGVVSCADILAFAARDATLVTGGIGWEVPAGRRDSRVSMASQTLDIPAPFFDLEQTTQSFANKGLSQEDMVTLSGAHTIGRSHCTSFSNRLHNFSPIASQDPTLDPLYAAKLKHQCPVGPQGAIDPNLVVPMNFSPAFMDTSYYKDILFKRGLFTSDQTLITSPETASAVRLYAFNTILWQKDFAKAMAKMSKIGVLTGSDGEIRTNCRVINP
ncbi:hypothetical protein LguiA_031728 [Lonicera macranthoides]